LEFFRFLARRGFVWSDGANWHWRTPEHDVLPVTVEAMIERAINEACVDTSIKSALEARAYVESLTPALPLTMDLWASLAGLDPAALEVARHALHASGIIDATHFSHPLFREVPFRALGASMKQTLARRALEVLPLELGAVFIEDSHLGETRSLELLRGAARESAAPGRWLALATQYASGAEQAQLALEAARALAFTDFAQAEGLYRQAVTFDSDVMLEFIEFLCRQNPSEAQALFEGLSQELRESARASQVRVAVLNTIGDQAGIVAFWQDQLGGSATLEVDVLVHVIWALKSQAHFDEAIGLAEQILRRTDLSPWHRARVLNRLASSYGESVRYAKALEITEALLEHLQTHDLGRREVVLHDRALFRKQLGDLQAAALDLEEALPLALGSGDTFTEMMCRSFLGNLYAELGRYAASEELLLEAHGYQALRPVSPYLADTLHCLIELYLAWTERPSNALLAQKYAQRALECAQTLDTPSYLAGARVFAGLVELEHSSAERTLQLALEALELRVPGDLFFGLWFPKWLEAKARAKLGQPNMALYEAVFEGMQTIGRTFEAQQVGLELDRLRHDLVSAKARLEWFQSRGLENALRVSWRLFPELTDQPAQQLKVALPVLQVLGPLRMQDQAVRGEKRQSLLIMLLEARIQGRSDAPTLELLEALYPNTPELEAASGLKQTVFKIRSVYGQKAVLTTATGYALGELESDAERFLRTGDTSLWRGSYLQDQTQGANPAVLEVLSLALIAKIGGLLESDPSESARLGRILLTMEPYDLTALRLTCEALRKLNNHRSLARVYSAARAQLLEVGEVLPERWQGFLASPD
jgi:tetratricopeptide (TPR) repeat protein